MKAGFIMIIYIKTKHFSAPAAPIVSSISPPEGANNLIEVFLALKDKCNNTLSHHPVQDHRNIHLFCKVLVKIQDYEATFLQYVV